ncbi:MAG: SGNH/GDSL hydrolase family protein [SAR324 cluster bacterium]|nr:SGNH/GDSL hydrolase family protein [SAR324 cluster bacterium]
MQNTRTFNPRWFGFFCILTSLGFNRYTVPYLFFFPPPLESSLLIDMVGIIEIVLFLVGLGVFFFRPSIPKPKLGEVLLTGVSVFLTLLLSELAAQYWLEHIAHKEQLEQYGGYDTFLRNKVSFIPHHYLNYAPNPDYELHNDLGYRGDSFPLEKPEGEFRIVAIGGSTTYSSRVSDNAHTYPAQMEKLLKEQYRCPAIRVINGGMKGYTSFENLINLMFRVLDLNPDLVIVYQATNDVHTRLVDPVAYRGDNSGYRRQWKIPYQIFWDRLILIRILRVKLGINYPFSIQNFVGAPTQKTRIEKSILLESNPPVYFERNLKSMIALAQIHPFQLMFATWAHSPHLNDYAANSDYQRAFQEHNNITRKLAQQHQVPLFDFVEQMPQDPKYWHDGRHVNDAGALRKAELFTDFIVQQQLIPTQHCEDL